MTFFNISISKTLLIVAALALLCDAATTKKAATTATTKKAATTAATTASATGSYPQLGFSLTPSYMNNKEVVLTFDDGPGWNCTTTIAVLDTLKAKGKHATFFFNSLQNTATDWTGKDCQLCVERIISEGHQLGSHTRSHPHLGDITVAATLQDEIWGVQPEIESYTSKTYPSLVIPTMSVFRAPFGEPFQWKEQGDPQGDASFTRVADVVAQKFVQIGWNLDTEDWVCPDPSPASCMYANVTKLLQQGQYGVMLMHSTQQTTAAGIGMVIDYLDANGYTILTLETVIERVYGMGSTAVVAAYNGKPVPTTTAGAATTTVHTNATTVATTAHTNATTTTVKTTTARTNATTVATTAKATNATTVAATTVAAVNATTAAATNATVNATTAAATNATTAAATTTAAPATTAAAATTASAAATTANAPLDGPTVGAAGTTDAPIATTAAAAVTCSNISPHVARVGDATTFDLANAMSTKGLSVSSCTAVTILGSTATLTGTTFSYTPVQSGKYRVDVVCSDANVAANFCGSFYASQASGRIRMHFGGSAPADGSERDRFTANFRNGVASAAGMSPDQVTDVTVVTTTTRRRALLTDSFDVDFKVLSDSDAQSSSAVASSVASTATSSPSTFNSAVASAVGSSYTPQSVTMADATTTTAAVATPAPVDIGGGGGGVQATAAAAGGGGNLPSSASTLSRMGVWVGVAAAGAMAVMAL